MSHIELGTIAATTAGTIGTLTGVEADNGFATAREMAGNPSAILGTHDVTSTLFTPNNTDIGPANLPVEQVIHHVANFSPEQLAVGGLEFIGLTAVAYLLVRGINAGVNHLRARNSDKGPTKPTTPASSSRKSFPPTQAA